MSSTTSHHAPIGEAPPDEATASAADRPVSGEEWRASNGLALQRALDALRAHALDRLDASAGDGTASVEIPSPPALERLAILFGLSSFETGVVLLCVAHELDARFAPIFAALQGDAARTYPTFALASAILPEPHADALTPLGRLRRWRLVELVGEGALATTRIGVDERVLHYVTGHAYVDRRVAGMLEEVDGDADVPDAHVPAVEAVVDAWLSGGSPAPLVVLSGEERLAARAVAAAACAVLGLRLHEIRAADLPTRPEDREPLQRLLTRESMLLHCALYVDVQDVASVVDAEAVQRLVCGIDGLVVMAARGTPTGMRRDCVRIGLPTPPAMERLAAWRRALAAVGHECGDEIEAVALQFQLSTRDMAAACRRLPSADQGATRDDVAKILWSACRERARGGLDQLADRMESRATWDDIVLPEAQLASLRLVALHVRHRALVHERWGFATQAARGRGTSTLLVGGSGHGKSLSAEVLANELDLDLYRVDLASVVSKYVGETEKNLKRIFDAAEASGAILLFDEADALFGRRSDVKDSHDRYANIEVSYLLQRIETYRGLAILATNMREALDPAFLRRLRFVIHFPFPAVEQRRAIWSRAFPESVPREGIDPDLLARLPLAGGNIRNVALNAAFLAAAAGGPVRMSHLRTAVEAEYAKLERPLLESEIGDWQ